MTTDSQPLKTFISVPSGPISTDIWPHFFFFFSSSSSSSSLIASSQCSMLQ
uniref:Uncharacterized protein n=1 Tax=Anguilla anguilla TaxID=7936 RepID=A0A0E9SZB1_ANGAN